MHVSLHRDIYSIKIIPIVRVFNGYVKYVFRQGLKYIKIYPHVHVYNYIYMFNYI